MIIGESCPRACDTLSTPVSAAKTNSGCSSRTRRTTCSATSRSMSSHPATLPEKWVRAARSADLGVIDPIRLRLRQSAADHVQRAEARVAELEDRRRVGGRCRGRSRPSGSRRSSACSPGNVQTSRARSNQRSPGSPIGPGIPPHEKGRVRRSGDRWKARRDRMERAPALVAQPRQAREGSTGQRRVERVGTRAVGEQNDDGQWTMMSECSAGSGRSPLCSRASTP